MKINSLSLFLLLCPKNKKYFYFLFFFVSNIVLSQTSVTITKTGDNYWTVPCDVTSITLEVWGAGGGGQAVNGTNVRGAGGAGGGFVKTTYTVVPGQTYRIYVGLGGTGNDTRKSGEGSWFESASAVFAVGGTGAGLVLTSGVGTGAVALTTGNIGGTLINTYGGNGADGFDDGTTKYSGGGGSSAGDVNGNNASGITGGTAPTNGYKGGDGRNSDNTGVNGGVGAGGSGAFRNSTTGVINGGAGGNGQVKITYTSYCTKYYNSQVAPITRVIFAGIDNSSTATVDSTTPFNEIFCSVSASVEQGMPYNITLKGNSNGNNTDYYRVYIDWDQNKVFGNNVNEVYDIGTITKSTGTDSQDVTGIIDVPSNAVLGATMMRIVKLRGAYTDACTAANYGQSEDYQVNIKTQSPCSGAPPTGNVKLSASSGTPGGTFSAWVIGSVSGSEFSYQWQKSSDNVNWVDISGASSETANIIAEALGSTYYYRRLTTCKKTEDVAQSTSASYTGAYCIPTFASSNTGKLYIESFKFIGVLNDDFLTAKTSTQSGPNGVYENWTTLTPIAEQVRGSVVNIEAISDGTFTVNGLVGWGYWMAWVDWNRDGLFDDATERVYALQDYLTKSVTFGFVITPDKPLGDYRIRIATMSNKSTDPCGLSSANGEVEDYMFRVVEDNQAKLDTSKPNLFSRCGDGDISLQVYGDANATGFNWYSAKYGGSLVNTGNVFTTYITDTTTYYVAVVDGNGKETPFRYPIIARKDPVPVVYFTPTPETICGEDDPSLLLNVWGDNREVVLFDEKFGSGLGVFNTQSEDTNVSNGSIFTGYSYVWKTVASPLEQKNPPHLAIASSVSSGYFGGNFAIMNSDGAARLGGKNIKRHLYTINTYNTNAFLPNKLYLDFDLYYFSIALLEADGYLRVEYSLDGTNWTKFKTFVFNQGNPLFWSKNALDLDALGVPRSSNIKFRFSLFSRGLSSGGYFENVATLDNVKLWGSIPVDRDYEWSGIDAGVLYDKTCTTPLGTTWARTVCVKPPINEFEKPYWDLYASATFQGGCPANGSTRVYNDTKIWNQPGKTDWKQSDDWKPVGVPDIKKCVIARTPVELPSLTTGTHGLARSVIVKSGGKLTINPKSSLTIQNYLKNEAAASDVLVESDANLLQINNSSVNIGNITVKRNANLKRLDYTYWGSPVAGQNVKAFSAGTLDTRFYVYNESNDYFDGLFIRNLYPDNVTYSLTPTVDKNTHTFIKGKGYAIRASNALSNVLSSIPHSFVGVPNNGLASIPVVKSATGQGYNLISNPYPSNIDFYALYNYGTNSSIIYNTAYFWTNTNYNPKMQGAKYPSNLPDGTKITNNYAILNGTGGVSAPYASGTGNNDPIGSPSNCPECTKPNEFIKVGQGFIVKVKDTGIYNLSLENNNGIRNNNSTSVFFNRMANNNQRTNVEKDRFWISLKTPLDFVSPILIGYPQGSTTNYEEDYDAELLIYGGDSFYSNLDNKKLAIQGRGYPFNPSDEVTLGARLGLEGQYEISLDAKEGVFMSQQSIFLYDKYLGVTTDISKEKYVFSSKAGDFGDRFVIQYSNQGTLNTSNNLDKLLKVYQSSEYIIIDSPDIVSSLKIYDVSGKLSFQTKPDKKRVEVHSSRFLSGVYILNIETKEGNVIKKITKK